MSIYEDIVNLHLRAEKIFFQMVSGNRFEKGKLNAIVNSVKRSVKVSAIFLKIEDEYVYY